MPVVYTQKPRLNKLRRSMARKSRPYFIFGARRLMRLMILRATTGCISLKFALVRFEVRRRKWLLPPLVRTTLPEPVRRKRFEVALWVLSLVFPPAFALRGIADFSFQTILDKINRGTKRTPADFQHLWDLPYDSALASFSAGACSLFSFFLTTPLRGAINTSIVRPSICGACSTMATSASAAAISFKSSSAISG